MPNQNPYQRRASVTITFDAASEVVDVSEDRVYILPGGEIEWQCADGDWTLTVEDSDTLFHGGNTLRGSRGERKTGRVLSDAHRGQRDGRRYKYTVAVEAGQKRGEKDPEVIVGPGEPEGGNGG